MAEISVPAWPIPIHHTKLVMAKPHITGVCDAPDAHALGQQQRHATSRNSSSRPNADREAGQPEERRAPGQHHGGDLVGDRAEGVARRDDPAARRRRGLG